METHNNLSVERNSAQLNLYQEIINLENLFTSWHEFKSGKRKRRDVMLFERNLEDNLFDLHHELKNGIYHHSQYTAFYITDPKLRRIHKAKVRDRIVHHAIVRMLYPIFDRSFIYDSYSCRIDKGTHRAICRLESFIRKESCNFSEQCFVLKCDIKKFFDSVDHRILFEIIKQKIDDSDVLLLLQEIINSFTSKIESQSQLGLFDCREVIFKNPKDFVVCKGIPIGNLTSQLFANIYMNEFDQFIKHKLRVKCFCRYTDDFVLISNDRNHLANLLPKIQSFLENELKLELHPNKISIRKIQQGIDFLGYVVLPHYRIVRTKTKKRIFKKLKVKIEEFKNDQICEKLLYQSLNSFLAVLFHANSHNLEQKLKNHFWFWLKE